MSEKDFILEPEYNFLRTNPLLGGNICLLALGGSHAYGTNIEGSDIDLRGFAIEDKNSILCGNRFEQVQDKETDTTIYGLSKLFKLLSGCNPNIIEMLGCKEYLFLNAIGQKVLDNKDLFLSQSAYYTFSGYASAQMKKLSISASSGSFTDTFRNDNLLHAIETNLHNVCVQRGDSDKSYTIDLSLPDVEERSDNLLEEVTVRVRFNGESLAECHDIINSIYGTVSSFAKGSKHNAEALKYNKINKHMMHLLRLYMMVIDILKDGKIITYREKEHDLLMSIRNGDYLKEDGKIKEEFFDIVTSYENAAKNALEKTFLPKRADSKKINSLLFDIYEEFLFF